MKYTNDIKTTQELKNEVRFLKRLSKKYTRVNAECRKKLEKRGYILTELGCGKSSYICSKDVSILEPKGRRNESKYNYPLLSFGVSNVGRGKSQIYRAFTKDIKINF